MKKIIGLEDWHLDTSLPDSKHVALVKMYFSYPNLEDIIHLPPNERLLSQNKYLKTALGKLLASGSFETYTLLGKKNRPTGVEAAVSLAQLKKIAKQPYIAFIFIESIKGNKKSRAKNRAAYYCVKMTIAIQVEGLRSGMQTYEERYVMIKASSYEAAYRKVETQSKKYETPYLNSKGALVRWKIESYDDCYSIDITKADQIEQPEGIEVYSVLKSRRLTPGRIWDGKIE